jgi:hypothetical protein
MFRFIRISGLAALLFGVGAGTGLLPSAAGQSPPETVTSDTLTYCRQLSERLDQLRSTSTNPPESVIDLSVAGKDLCERGSIRSGILRLRSAIVLLLHEPATANTLQMGRTE